MAPRTKRSRPPPSSSALGAISFVRFETPEAHARYDDFVRRRRFIAERGFTVREVAFPLLFQIIHAFQWEEFCKQPPDAVLPLVCEFYANGSFTNRDYVTVRGVQVYFTPAVINGIWGLEAPIRDHYAALLSNLTDDALHTIVRRICTPGTNYQFSARHAVNIPRQNLLSEVKPWYLFLCSRILPSLHLSDLTKERAVLLYVIMERQAFDIGVIIYQAIRDCFRQPTSSLLYPSLVTLLCRRANVPIDAAEELVPRQGSISSNVMRRLERGAVPPPYPGAMPPPAGARVATLPQRLRGIDQRLSHMEVQQYFIQQDLQQILTFQNYQAEVNRALERQLRQISLTVGSPLDSMYPWPQPPLQPDADPMEAEIPPEREEPADDDDDDDDHDDDDEEEEADEDTE